MGVRSLSTPFLVTVTGGDIDKKTHLFKDVREVTGFGLKETKDVIEGALSIETDSEDDARYVAQVLSEAGATCSVLAAAAAPHRPRLRASTRGTATTLGIEGTPDHSSWPAPQATGGPRKAASQVQRFEIARARAMASKFAERVHAAYEPPVAQLSFILNELNEKLAQVQSACDAMRSALSVKGIESSPCGNLQPQLPLDRWLTEVHRATKIAGGSLPILKSSKLNKLREIRDQCLPLLQQETCVRIELETNAARNIESVLGGSFGELKTHFSEAWVSAIEDNPRAPGLDWWSPAWQGNRLEPGAGLHPTVSPAVARFTGVATSVSLSGPHPGSRVFVEAVNLTGTGSTHDSSLPNYQIEIDLDRDGGFVTGDKVAIETATVDLLGQLPGGRVKVDVIDPLELGDSARFLFDLNDARDRILADAIWTKTEHTAKVLVQLEEHITFVTQKYLQGRNSLTEYNIEAGEIAEPYRLLLLYDYPAGFSRDGKHFDEEHLTRLERIAAVGRRAGVYIFAHVPTKPAANHLGPLVQLTPEGLGLHASPAPSAAGTSIPKEGDVVLARVDKYLSAEDIRAGKGTGQGFHLTLESGLPGFMGGSPGDIEVGGLFRCFVAHVSWGGSYEEQSAKARLDRIWLILASAAGKVASDASGLNVAEAKLGWEVVPHASPDEVARRALFAGLLRDLQGSETAKVDPSTIFRLSQARHGSDVQKGLAVECVVDVADSATWWRSVSTDRLQLSFGRMGASDVARVEFNSALESSALIGGRTGSGKSYLIHALIMDAVTRYSPEELTLYLCDLKEGVEFKQYADARLPHARAIAVESNREFAISLLEALDLEITERGALFKAKAGGTAVNITQFRQESGQTWPRVIIVIDEFHKLFEQDDRLARRAMQLLERVIKEGRAFGVHTILASQSLANVDASFRSLAGQIPYRLVLASSDNDSRILLGEDNADAKLLNKAGEGILNAKGGARESNQRFQTTFWAPAQRQAILECVAELARRSGFDRHPHVFEGNAEVRADDYDPNLYRGDSQGIVIPVGAPMSMEAPVTTKFERGPGSNLLVVDVDGLGSLAVLITSLIAQRVDVTAVDFAAIEQEWEPVFDALVAQGLDKPNRRRIDEVVNLLAKEVAERHASSDYRAEAKVLVLVGVHRARELDPEDYDDESLLAKIRRLVKDGPEVGIHVIVWADRKASLDRRFDSQTLREFGLRFLGRMSEDDSRSLADTEQAASITPAQLVFDDFDKAVTVVVRRLGFPGPEWIGDVIAGG